MKYCKNCKWLNMMNYRYWYKCFCFCDGNNSEGYCVEYKRKWWKFWVMEV